ncbi:MAG: glycosyltransferase family 4 protein [Richelia sp. RM2_1_2]|nr:glycosyltransferase family 4 protein [Richelia sp. RM2_1_2]
MKILHVINSFEGGGAEKLTLQLHEAYLNQGIDSHVVSIKKSSAGNLPNTDSLCLKSPYQILALFKLYSFLSQPRWKDLDIIHVHLFPSQLYTPIIIKLLGFNSNLITTEHSTYNWRRKFYFGKFIDRLTYSFYKKIICISNGASTALKNWQPQISQKITVIYNGINIDDYSPFNKSTRKDNPNIIVSVGRLVKLKNYETAIRALSKLSDYSYEYWIIGSGDLEFQLKKLVNSLNLELKIKFLGFRKDVPQLLNQADIFLQTSLWEGFGLAVVEAMAAGLTVVVSDVPGLREVVTEESKEAPNVGFLINPLSEDDIADKLSKLLNNPSLGLRMSQNARLRSSKFDINQTFYEYIDLCKKLVQLKD